MTESRQAEQMLQILWSLHICSPIFFFLVMVAKLYVNSYCARVLTDLSSRQPYQAGAFFSFFLFLFYFFTGTCFTDLKNRHCVVLNWHIWKMNLIPLHSVSVVPSLYVHLPSRRPQVTGVACLDCTAGWWGLGEDRTPSPPGCITEPGPRCFRLCWH